MYPGSGCARCRCQLQARAGFGVGQGQWEVMRRSYMYIQVINTICALKVGQIEAKAFNHLLDASKQWEA